MKINKIETPKYVTYKELTRFTRQLPDYRDRLIIMLIFDGYYVNMEEIQNLRKDDVIEGKKCNYIKDKKISSATYKYIQEALKEKEIHTYSQFNNGIDTLIESDYLVRERQGYISRANVKVDERFNGFAMNKQSIINRFAKLKRTYGFNLSLSSIYASGVIYRVKEKVPYGIKNHRQEFLRFAEKEGVKEGMGRLYYKQYLDMYSRFEAEKDDKTEEDE